MKKLRQIVENKKTNAGPLAFLALSTAISGASVYQNIDKLKRPEITRSFSAPKLKSVPEGNYGAPPSFHGAIDSMMNKNKGVYSKGREFKPKTKSNTPVIHPNGEFIANHTFDPHKYRPAGKYTIGISGKLPDKSKPLDPRWGPTVKR